MRRQRGSSQLNNLRFTFDDEPEENPYFFVGHALAPDVDKSHQEGLSEEVDVENASSNHASKE